MYNGAVRLAWSVALVAAATVLGGCHRADSILLIEVAGDERLMVAQLAVAVTVGSEERDFQIPSTPAAITLPTSFSLELDDSLTGPVTVQVAAYDQSLTLLGLGTTTQDHINVGGQTIITVTIPEVVTGPQDGSADDAGAGASP